MRSLIQSAFLATLAVLTVVSSGRADSYVLISVEDDSGRRFYLHAGEREPLHDRVIVVRERRIPADELAVVYFIAHRARVSPELVIQLRLEGRTWWDVTDRCGLSRDVYFDLVRRDSGPPYGKAHGHYKKTRQRSSKRLTDAQIIRIVHQDCDYGGGYLGHHDGNGGRWR